MEEINAVFSIVHLLPFHVDLQSNREKDAHERRDF